MMTPVTFDEHPLAWREQGEGPVALFLHGIGGSRISWESQFDGLADLRRCVAWDMPGYGASSGLPRGFGMLADAAADLVRRVSSSAVDVVGHSMGGMVAQHLAIEHPEVVRSIVLLDSSPAFGLDGITTAEQWLADRLNALEDGRTPADIAPDVIKAISGPYATAQAVDAAISAFQRIKPAAFEAACRTLVEHDVRERLGQIACPTLVVVGSEDCETPLSYSRALAAGIPRAQLSVIPRAGHLANTEAPAEVNDVIREFWQTSSNRADGMEGANARSE